MVSDSTEVLTAVWTSFMLNGCKTDGNILVDRHDVARRNYNSILNAVLFRNLIFKFDLQAVLMCNCVRVNSHQLRKFRPLCEAHVLYSWRSDVLNISL